MPFLLLHINHINIFFNFWYNMYFLFGISSILTVIKLYGHIAETLHKMMDNTTIVNIGIKGFMLYTRLQTNLSKMYSSCYEHDDFFRHAMNCVEMGYNGIVTNMYNYKKEPVDANWINISMLFRHNNDSSRKIVPKLIESYDMVHNHKSKQITDMVIHRKMLYFNHADTPNQVSTDPMTMYVVKHGNKYLCNHHCFRLYEQWTSSMNTVNNPFFEIEYIDKESDFSCTIDLPRNYFIENNEILSIAFLKRWFDYNYMHESFTFNDDYQLSITDDAFDNITLDRMDYIVLKTSGYSIEKTK